jgi:hypothetical protein
MPELEKLIVSCSKWQEIVGAINRVNRELPIETRKRLNEIISNYLASYGARGVFERLNDRSVAQIFAEYKRGSTREITSGEVDGVRYRLYEAPPARSKGSESAPND